MNSLQTQHVVELTLATFEELPTLPPSKDEAIEAKEAKPADQEEQAKEDSDSTVECLSHHHEEEEGATDKPAEKSEYYKRALRSIYETGNRPAFPKGAFCYFSQDRRNQLRKEQAGRSYAKLFG